MQGNEITEKFWHRLSNYYKRVVKYINFDQIDEKTVQYWLPMYSHQLK